MFIPFVTLLWSAAVYGAFLDPVYKQNMDSRVSLQTLKKIKLDLQAELKSLVQPVATTQQSIDPLKHDELLILPSNLLSSDIYEKLGLDFLNTDSYTFTLNDREYTVPKDFKNMFLFNTSKPLAIPTSKHHNFARFVDESLPFSLPGYMNLLNHYLVLPKKYVQQKLNLGFNDTCTMFNEASIFSRSIVTSPVSELPIFRSIISENKPLMVFMFSDSSVSTFQKLRNPIMNIKNYLNSEKFIFSNFFDTFASNWIQKVSYDSLISSVFCTTNRSNLTDSYCLQVFDKKALFLFPAFYDMSQLLNLQRSQKVAKREDTDVESQAIRQVHDKLSAAVDKLNDVTYELATEPKQLVERVDERLDQKRYHVYDKVDAKKDKLQDKKDEIKEKILSSVDAVKGKLGVVKNLQSDEFDLGNNPYDIHDSLMSKRDFEQEEQALLPFQPEGGLILPLSLVRVEEHLVQTPRSKSYSQVLFDEPEEQRHTLSKRFSIFSSDSNCEKITWYNVFHHSIFGKPKFCLDK